METKYGFITLGDKTLHEDDSSDYENEDVVGVLYKPPVKACDFSHPALSSPNSRLKPPLMLFGLGVTKVSCFVLKFFCIFFHIPSS